MIHITEEAAIHITEAQIARCEEECEVLRQTLRAAVTNPRILGLLGIEGEPQIVESSQSDSLSMLTLSEPDSDPSDVDGDDLRTALRLSLMEQ